MFEKTDVVTRVKLHLVYFLFLSKREREIEPFVNFLPAIFFANFCGSTHNFINSLFYVSLVRANQFSNRKAVKENRINNNRITMREVVIIDHSLSELLS